MPFTIYCHWYLFIYLFYLSFCFASLTILAINYGLCYFLNVYLQRSLTLTFYRLLLPPSGQKNELNGYCWMSTVYHAVSSSFFCLLCTGWKHHEVSAALWKCHLENREPGDNATDESTERAKRTKKEKEEKEKEGCTWNRKGTAWLAIKTKQGSCYSVWNGWTAWKASQIHNGEPSLVLENVLEA